MPFPAVTPMPEATALTMSMMLPMMAGAKTSRRVANTMRARIAFSCQ